MNKALKKVSLILSSALLVGTMSAFTGCFGLIAAITGGVDNGNDSDNDYSDGAPSYTHTVYAPDGAPALALANGMANNASNFQYNVVDASTIQTYVTGENPTADFCILPLNAASKLLGTGETYQMLGTVTNGNMYFLTASAELPTLTEMNITTLVGKTVGVVQLANVPGLTLQATLNKYNVPYTVMGNDDVAKTDVVNLKAVDAATGVTPAGGCDYYLCPEPAATTKVTKTSLKFAGDLQELYGENGYPQAVAVAKVGLPKEHIAHFVALLQGSASYLKTATVETVVENLDKYRTEGLTPSFTAENLTADVIENCSISFTASKDCKALVNAFITELIAVNSTAAKAVSDNFFYMD